MTITYKNYNKIASRIAPSGNSYELQEVTLEKDGEQVLHPDGEKAHYRVTIVSPKGLFLGAVEFGVDARKANEWMMNRK